MSRDFSRALENIRKVMRSQDADFRREMGLAPKQKTPQPGILRLTPEPEPKDTQPGKASSVNLPADRFLNTSIDSETDNAPEIVEVIQQKDSRHSWLYNEVAKAVQNASGNNPNTKIVAVFVPVVQSGHEFEELPVHETVELPPVNEEDFRIEDEIDIQEDPQAAQNAAHESEPEVPDLPEELSAEPEQAEHLGELIPDSMEHPDPELAEAFNTMEEKLDEHIAAENEDFDEDVSGGEKMPFTEIPADDSETLPDLAFPDELEDDEITDDIYESSEESKAN